MKNILVTGGTGYIGSHTTVELLNKGYDVTIIDNLSNSRVEVLDAVLKITGKRPLFVEMDLCDKEAVSSFFKQHKIDATIHFAAFKAVGESVEEPLVYYRNNLESLMNLLEIYREKKLDNLVFSSRPRGIRPAQCAQPRGSSDRGDALAEKTAARGAYFCGARDSARLRHRRRRAGRRSRHRRHGGQWARDAHGARHGVFAEQRLSRT